MAERRMFAKSVVMCDVFLEMKPQTRCLYYSLCMAADDDGLVDSYRTVSYYCGAKPKNLQELVEKNYVKVFDNGVLGILHWRVNNQIRKDRYRESRYSKVREELLQLQDAILEPKMATKTVTQKAPIRETQDREDQTSQDQNNLVQFREDKSRQAEPVPPASSDLSSDQSNDHLNDSVVDQVMKLYQTLCPSLYPCYPGLPQQTVDHIEQLVQTRGMETVEQLFRKAEQTPFIRGEVKKEFRGSLPWLVRPETVDRVLNGGFESWRKEAPKGATGRLGAAELAAIQRALKEE